MDYLEEAKIQFDTEQEQKLVDALKSLLEEKAALEMQKHTLQKRIDLVDEQLNKASENDEETLNNLINRHSAMNGKPGLKWNPMTLTAGHAITGHTMSNNIR